MATIEISSMLKSFVWNSDKRFLTAFNAIKMAM